MSSWNLTAFYLLMHRLGLGYWCFYCLRAVNALMGPRVDKHKTVCANQSKAFIDVWFSSSYHVVYDIYIYIYIFLNIIVSLIELFGFKLFSLVLNKSFSFPFEPFGNAFGLNADINPLQNNSCLPAIFVVWPCYESYLNLMLNWIKLLISNNLSLSHLQRISHDLVNKIFTYLSKNIYIYIYIILQVLPSMFLTLFTILIFFAT